MPMQPRPTRREFLKWVGLLTIAAKLEFDPRPKRNTSIYVDPLTQAPIWEQVGNAAAPFATLQQALDAVPAVLREPQTIVLAPYSRYRLPAIGGTD